MISVSAGPKPVNRTPILAWQMQYSILEVHI